MKDRPSLHDAFIAFGQVYANECIWIDQLLIRACCQEYMTVYTIQNAKPVPSFGRDIFCGWKYSRYTFSYLAPVRSLPFRSSSCFSSTCGVFVPTRGSFGGKSWKCDNLIYNRICLSRSLAKHIVFSYRDSLFHLNDGLAMTWDSIAVLLCSKHKLCIQMALVKVFLPVLPSKLTRHNCSLL